MNQKTLEKAFKYIDQWLSHKEMNFDFPGLSIAIASKDQVLYEKGFGYANLESSEKMTSRHSFRYASHSKTFTAVSILQLVQESKIKLDDPISSYLDFLNPDDSFLKETTIRQALSHSAGIRRDDVDSSYWLGKKNFPSSEELKDSLSLYSTKIENNTAFNYSNIGYALLGCLIEQISKQSFKDYIDQNITQPLKLSSVGMDKPPSVTGYTTKFNATRRALKDTPSTGGIAPAAGISGTPSEMALFYANLLSNDTKLLNREMQKEIRKPLWSIPECGDQKYGLGLIFENDLIGHNGNFLGQSTSTFFSSETGLVVSVAKNAMSVNPMEFVKGINHILSFFQNNEKVLEDESLALYNSTLYNMWGASLYTPVGRQIYCTEPDYMYPFKNATILSPLKIKEHTFRVTLDNGYGFSNEIVQFSLDKNQNIISSDFGGYTSVPKDAFEKER